MVRNDIKKSSLLRTKVLIYAFNGRTVKMALHSPTPPRSFRFYPIRAIHLSTAHLGMKRRRLMATNSFIAQQLCCS